MEGARGRQLAVVVVNFGVADLLERNLGRVADDLPVPGGVYVVDNWHSAAERAAVERLAADRPWVVLPQSSNLGFGAGVNLGVARARADGATDLLVLNPDAVIDRASMTALLDATASGEVMASPVIRTPDGRPWFAGLDLYLEDGSIAAPRRRAMRAGEPYVEWLSGACLCVPMGLWDRTEGFDEEYFLYWEDVDFSRRVAAAGGRLTVVEDAVAVHDEGATHQQGTRHPGAKSTTYYYFNIRNRMLFAARHLDPAGVRRWQATAPGNAYRVLLRGGRRQFLHPVAPVTAALRGLRDGRRIAKARRVPGAGQ